MVSLAGPVVLAEIGWMFMGIVDTIMVGRLGAEALGAVGVASTLFMALALSGFGILLGLEPLISQAFGAGRLEDCHRWLFHGVYLSLLMTPPMMAATWLGIDLLPHWGFHPAVLPLMTPYLRVVAWSVLPLFLYGAFRRYLQSMGIVLPIVFALVSANVVNALANWVLIFGKLGAPALGVEGAAWATCLSRVYMALVLLAAIAAHDARQGVRLVHTPIAPDIARLGRLLRVGGPAAIQLLLEVGVFAAATALAGRLAPIALAAHQIALNVAAFTFMVPLGIGMAGSVRVGHAVGRRDPVGVSRAGWTALALGGSFMSGAALTFLLFPRAILRVFTADHAVIQAGVVLLFVAAVFQLFDGLQGVATGVLRGLGDTRTPMLWNLAGHWALGLPLGYALCFIVGVGVVGLWIGLSAGLIVVGTVLVVTWARRERGLRRILGASSVC